MSLMNMFQKGAMSQFLGDQQLKQYAGKTYRTNIGFRIYSNQALASLLYYNSYQKTEFLKGIRTDKP